MDRRNVEQRDVVGRVQVGIAVLERGETSDRQDGAGPRINDDDRAATGVIAIHGGT